MSEHRIKITVNGRSHGATVEGRLTLGDFPARQRGLYRRASGLRTRRVRRLYGDRQWPGGAFLPDAGGAG